jgi:hypothetical protein
LKIGIFGDSFSTERTLWNEYKNYNHLQDFGMSWVAHCRIRNPNWQIKNYSQPGTCLYFSYYHYLENKHKFDKIIFVYTNHGRFSKKTDRQWLSVPSAASAREKMKGTDILSEKLFYKAAQQFIVHVQDDKKERILWKLMHDDIKKDDKVFSVYAFPDPYKTKHNLRVIQILEGESAKLKQDQWSSPFSKVVDMRYNHITGINNQILAKEITKQILDNQKEFTLDINKYQFDTAEIQKHFVSSKHLKKNLK